MNTKKYNKEYESLKQKMLNCAPEDYEKKGVIFDGVVCPKTYFNQPLKVMVVLAEHYGWDSWEPFHIDSQLEKDFIGINNPTVKTPRRILSLLWLLLNSLDNNKKVLYKDMPYLLSVNNSTSDELNGIFKRICYVNTRKDSKAESENSTKQNYNEIYDAGIRYKEVLKKQIDLSKPDLIICCSDPVINTFIDNSIIEAKAENPNKKWTLLPIKNSNALLFNTTHPSYNADWGYEGIYSSFEILWKHFR